ncbi:MAG: zinc-dependent metalloprotease family protein [Pyrinomonadaceae bacterium]
MASLRHFASCIGLSRNFSVLNDFYGYITGPPKALSLLRQIRLLKGKHIHFNLIIVGLESFDDIDQAEIDNAVDATRDFYVQVDLGVGRVKRFIITTAQANGRDNIDNDSEAEDLTQEWTIDNDALDVFFVLTYAGLTTGRSAVLGGCDKDSKGMSGSVVAIDSPKRTTGFTLAHEVAHYLGVDHTEDEDNLMFFKVPNGGTLSDAQGFFMRQHCFVKAGC